VWVVRSGLVNIVKSGPAGREIVLEVLGPGELFGVVAVVEGRTYPASAAAVEPSVVWSVPATVVQDLCREHPDLKTAIMAHMTTRLHVAHERLASIALEPVEQRLARLVLSLADRLARDAVLHLTRQELANIAGTTVETAIRVTSKWQRAGLVRTGRGEIELLDPAALKTIAAGTG
jgi:CRP/FNR family transcriptional regulator